MEDFDVTIIGGGIVGLAVAAVCPKAKGLLIERHPTFGQETSSRNSEVVHAGIYYPTDSFKAKFCVEGRRMLYSMCEKYNIKYNKLGKIIVAVNEDESKDLENLFKQGMTNGVEDLKMLSSNEIKKMEPHVKAISGIYSPHTGIVDTHNVMRHFELKAKENGFTFAYGCRLVGISQQDALYKITVEDVDGESYDFSTRVLVNSAGLESHNIARMVGIDEYELHYCKGEYFRVSGGKSKYISRLIYPHPTETSLGIHTVLDLQGQIKLGPNAFYVDEINYDVDISHAEKMWKSVKEYLPFIELEDLSPDMAGIRPKLQAPGEQTRDFVITHEEKKGLFGFINLIGIESPGLTAVSAIAKYVVSMECFGD